MNHTVLHKWFAADVLVAADAAEAIEFAFNELDALGTEIDGLRKRPDEPLVVTGFFESLPDKVYVQTAVLESLRIFGLSAEMVGSIQYREIVQTDWLAEWKKHWKATKVGKFVIAPPWETVSADDSILIRIEPNMAFGTGTHETTQLCLKSIGERCQSGQTVLDVGTGTGILAIAAARLGADTIFACDTDADSIKIARENAAANGVGWIEFADGGLASDAPAYDFVVANLTLDVIIPILPLLLEKSRHTLLLSGILVTQKDAISRELSKFKVSDYRFEIAGEWLAVTVARR